MAASEHVDWWYWSLDLPGLTHDGAAALLRFAEQNGESFGSLVDPGEFLTVHLDRDTVETICAALKISECDPGADSLLEIFQAWLDP